MKILGKVLLWAASGLLLAFLLVDPYIPTKILLGVAILCLIPVSPVRKWIANGRKGILGAALTTGVAVVLVLVAALIGPPIETESREIVEAPAVQEETPEPSPSPEPSPEPSPAPSAEPTPEPTEEPTPEPPVEPTHSILPLAEPSPGGDGENFNKYNNAEQQKTKEYVLNTKTMKIHNAWCESVKKIAPENYATSSKSIAELEAEGYEKCGQKGDWG